MPYIENNELCITEINNKIYYKIIDVNKSNPKTSPVGFINIIFRRRLHHGEIDIEDILPNQQNSGLVKYINEGLLFYDPGEIKPRIDISFNNLGQSELNRILEDLLANWQAVKRGGVTINLKNQTSLQNSNVQLTPSETGFAAARFLVSKGWSIGITGGIPDEPEPE